MDKESAQFLVNILLSNQTNFSGDQFVPLMKSVSALQRIVEADDEKPNSD
tara:strand:- start:2789 stop:2938 length:150 start_codon:yes stop_codon:yes gene_type:complete